MTRSQTWLVRTVWLLSACGVACFSSGAGWSQTPTAATSNPADVQAGLRHGIEEMRAIPRNIAQYDYIMTARVRLLLFWAGKDDVGGGYIRRGFSPDDPTSEFLQIVMGSDPAKAPRAINRWGAATERLEVATRSAASESSTFFGFMKVNKGNSPAEMRKELDGEKAGGSFLFSAILNQANHNGSFAKTVPFTSDTDFTIHQLDQAVPVVFDRLEDSQGKIRTLDARQSASCTRPEGFLSSVAELVDDALDGHKTPVALCYVYNGQLFRLTLTDLAPVEHESVQLSLHGTSEHYVRDYRNLISARFENFNETSHQGSNFELLLGKQGDLRGVPVRISYQPNWWFQVVLNLKTPEDPTTAGLR